MKLVLSGNSPATLVAGILVLSRARSFGIPGVQVAILGERREITPVLGPAILHSNVLASCGVGRTDGQGPLVIVPGAPELSLLASLSREGLGPWFTVDTQGCGVHPATQAFVRLARDPRPASRALSRQLRAVLAAMGVPSEPGLMDLLFDAPTPPLTRLALTLRAGRSITGEPGAPWHRWLLPPQSMAPDPLDLPGGEVLDRLASGALEPWLCRLSMHARDAVEDWLLGVALLADQDGGRDLELVGALAELLTQVMLLPSHSMLPPPTGAEDAVATGLGRALGATRGQPDANQDLLQVFQFLGGSFVDQARHPVELVRSPAPPDRLGRWRWFVESVSSASTDADRLWRHLMDPAS